VPSLKTDRHIGLVSIHGGVDVRRLMYQLLICGGSVLAERLHPVIGFVEGGNQTRGLASTSDSQALNCAANALIDGMAGDPELGSDLL
jgi:hypothetical protein